GGCDFAFGAGDDAALDQGQGAGFVALGLFVDGDGAAHGGVHTGKVCALELERAFDGGGVKRCHDLSGGDRLVVFDFDALDASGDFGADADGASGFQCTGCGGGNDDVAACNRAGCVNDF